MLNFLISIAMELELPMRREAAMEACEHHDGWKCELWFCYLSFLISAKTMEEVSIPNLFPHHLIIPSYGSGDKRIPFIPQDYFPESNYALVNCE